MHFSDLFQALLTNTWPHSLLLFRPELILCATIVVMLLVRVLNLQRLVPTLLIAFVGSLGALWTAIPWSAFHGEPILRSEIFTGLLVYDSFTIYFRSILLVFAVLFLMLTWLSGIPDREDSADIYSLVLGGIIGMCLMASANHLLMIFLAVEMASVPSYALAGLMKGRRQSSEAALKYAVYGAGAAGIMLYGLSLLAGVLGSCHLPTMAAQLADLLSAGNLGDRTVVLALGGLMVGVGLCFKLAAVPFHFWCPDVFEGASAEVNAYLSVASKAAALALLVRVTIGFGYIPPEPAANPLALAALNVADPVATKEAPAATAPVSPASAHEKRISALEPVRKFMALVVTFIAAITCTFGNLAAYGQTNVKRLLAYSTIAHAGYMMMPVAAALLLAGSFPRDAELSISTVVFYTALYLFMNLGAFSIIAFLRNTMRSEEIADYAGLVRRSPGVVICFSLILFSLVGLPPLAGFVGKFAIFTSIVTAIKQNVGAGAMLTLLAIAGLNTAISLFYYLRLVKVMTMDPEPDRRAPAEFSLLSLPGAYVVLITLPVLALGFWFNDLLELAPLRGLAFTVVTEPLVMPQPHVINLLNEVLHTIYRSLPMFVSETSPYTHAGNDAGINLLAHITDDQKAYSERLVNLIMDLNGAPQPGQYPMLYTDLPLLSLDYLLKEITTQQQRDVYTLQACADRLAADERGRALVQEVLGNARGHLQSLKEFSAPAASV